MFIDCLSRPRGMDQMNRTPQHHSNAHVHVPALNERSNPLAQPAEPDDDGWNEGDDNELMAGISDQHQDALAALYDRYSSQVLNLCRRVTGREDIAEDAMLETFWELWQKPTRYQSNRGTPLTYVLILARCRAIDLMRNDAAHRHRPQKAVAHNPNLPIAQTPGEEQGTIGAGEGGTDDAAVTGALQSLDDKYRDAIQLCVLNGLTAAQAARALNIPLGTMKSRIRNALIQMRSLLRTH